jgi:hypothetical protein
MAKRRRRRDKGSRRPGSYLLAIQNPEALKAADAKAEELRSHLAAYYAALESQRAEHREAITQSLLGECRPFEFTRWQRKVSSRYMNNPLSARGSVMHALGHRFNIGQIDQAQYPPFPALYLASDQETALQEALGGIDSRGGLSSSELALKRTDSYAMYALSGEIVSVLDLVEGATLRAFVAVGRTFSVPKEITAWAKRLGFPAPEVETSEKQVLDSVMNPHWRQVSGLLNVPSASQTFGRMARAAGIEAIRYRSVKSGKPCLAVFPDNFAHSSSYVELDDPTPPEYPDLIRRLDRTSWPKLI